MANATLTIGLTSTPLTGSKSYTNDDVVVTRAIPALQAKFKKIGGPDLTAAQAFGAWADWTKDNLRTIIKKYEDDIAEKAGRDGVPPVNL